jgi:hypothetical protein
VAIRWFPLICDNESVDLIRAIPVLAKALVLQTILVVDLIAGAGAIWIRAGACTIRVSANPALAIRSSRGYCCTSR